MKITFPMLVETEYIPFLLHEPIKLWQQKKDAASPLTESDTRQRRQTRALHD
jgi:hypothetical protein